MPYALKTPYRNETWISDSSYSTPYARLAGRRLAGGTIDGPIPISITDIHRGISLLINGSTVTENQTPSQDDLAAADYYYLGGHEYTIANDVAAILIAAGYGAYVTLIV
jgi:hypothetical protein